VDIHRITVNSDEGIFDGKIDLKVHDRDDVKVIMDNLKGIDGLQEVQQIK
jgi:GTP pyrophosphokinase